MIQKSQLCPNQPNTCQGEQLTERSEKLSKNSVTKTNDEIFETWNVLLLQVLIVFSRLLEIQ